MAMVAPRIQVTNYDQLKRTAKPELRQMPLAILIATITDICDLQGEKPRDLFASF